MHILDTGPNSENDRDVELDARVAWSLIIEIGEALARELIRFRISLSYAVGLRDNQV